MKKNIILILIPLAIWNGIGLIVVWPWMYELDQSRRTFSILAHTNVVIWWIVLLWAFHHLTFQITALLKPPLNKNVSPASSSPSVAILYTTCDDFDKACCESCVLQDYWNSRVYILDDSKTLQYRQRAADFARIHPNCKHVTRTDSGGFKAGNINHALQNHVDEEWFLLVDADQKLPRDYVSRIIAKAENVDERVIFVQGSHCARLEEDQGKFAKCLGIEVSLFYDRDLVPRVTYGFVPLLGHGALIRHRQCIELGGFPNVVSEDFGFAMRACHQNWRGIFVADVISEEAYPYDFGAFMTRLKKFAGGTAELFRRELPIFLLGNASLVEKWDFMMSMLWYILMPMLVLNTFLSAYVVHSFWDTKTPFLHPILPFIYTWLLVGIFALSCSITRSFTKALRFYFWSTAVYTSALPTAAYHFIYHLFVRPGFQRTPKSRKRTHLRAHETIINTIIGISAFIFGIAWQSPFSPIVMAHGVAYACYGLYPFLSDKSFAGRSARLCVLIPGTLYIVGLAATWYAGW